jgi:hypothetical protein
MAAVPIGRVHALGSHVTPDFDADQLDDGRSAPPRLTSGSASRALDERA